MSGRVFKGILSIAAAALFASGITAFAQDPQGDTLRPRETSSAEVRLKAKVDSLRGALAEVSPERRRQSALRLLDEADSLRLRYDFRAASDLYRKASSQEPSLKEDADRGIALSLNGLSMMGYCSLPKVAARRKFSRSDFFLMYPLQDSSWRVDATGEPFFAPDSVSTIFSCWPDEAGVLNIRRMERTDSLWSKPRLLGEKLMSVEGEAFPMVGDESRTLYFSSKGLYGMGGYDLYMSRWNRSEGRWDEPVNMGFPYSSPYDDLLFVNSPDGKYSLFASNRECSQDSVYVYVLEYDALPARKSISDVQELRRLAALRPAAETREVATDTSRVDARYYMSLMDSFRSLRDSLTMYSRQLDIASMEEVQARLERATEELRDIEREFLSSGAVSSPADDEPDGPDFQFVRHSLGAPLQLTFATAEPERASLFSVEEESVIMHTDTLPMDEFYQILLSSEGGRLEAADMHGISPVFEKMGTNLKYTYTVGIFYSEDAALQHLNTVRKAGFPDATILKFN